jgi:hypothetical protein
MYGISNFSHYAKLVTSVEKLIDKTIVETDFSKLDMETSNSELSNKLDLLISKLDTIISTNSEIVSKLDKLNPVEKQEEQLNLFSEKYKPNLDGVFNFENDEFEETLDMIKESVSVTNEHDDTLRGKMTDVIIFDDMQDISPESISNSTKILNHTQYGPA